MKASIAVLTIVLFLAHLHAAPPANAPVGTIVPISGSLKLIDAKTGSISLEPDHIYFVTAGSVLTVNGKPGTLSDLGRGMKVTGSAEVVAAEGRNQVQKRIVRRL